MRVLVAGGAWMAILMAAPVSAQDGAALYAQRCASCHEGGQVARAPARDVIAALPAGSHRRRARDRDDARARRER